MALGVVEQSQVVQARGHIGMIRAERLLVNRQRALVQRLGLRVLALGEVEPSQVVAARGYIGVIGTQSFLINRQRALVQRLGLRVLALGFVEQSQAVQAHDHIGMVRAVVFLGHFESLPGDNDGTVIFARTIKLVGLLIKDVPFTACALIGAAKT